ncbi:hypothetical protein OUZ56_013815 [Daphnia magna]|uniref:EF-hand domain-containing protein n=1 Tax=Daphnia magna TaxID=35525 RepID=A0ABQ9Z708_9CRUS|nr:hypothetical protein OUZ56_013815 [Daphnia magna]
MDMFYLGDCLRALNLNPTLAQIEKMGGTKKKGEKKIKADEFLPIFCQIKKDKDVGTIEDFIECMKLYDKTDNGTMVFAELQHILMALGERLEDKEVDDILTACCDPEDDEGMIPYKRKLLSSMNAT